MTSWDQTRDFLFPSAPEFYRVSLVRLRILERLSLFLALGLCLPLVLSGLFNADWFNVSIDFAAGLAYLWVGGVFRRNKYQKLSEMLFLSISLIYFFFACYVDGPDAYFFAPLGMVFAYLVFPPSRALLFALVGYGISVHIGVFGERPLTAYETVRLIISGLLITCVFHVIACLTIQSIGKFNRLIALLRDRNRSLLRANGTQKMFLRSISHEFRTPLHGVITGLHSLNSSGLDVMQRKITNDIEDACKTLDELLFRIIDLNEAEKGHLKTNQKDFELARLIRRLAAYLETVSIQYDLKVDVDIASDLPEFAVGDVKRLEQALEELILNVARLLRNGEIVCRVAPRFTFANQFLLVIELVDDGRPEVVETLKVLREAFARHRRTSMGGVSRRDVGLSLAFSLIKLMKGHVIAIEKLGKRSNITLELPLKIGESEVRPAVIPKLENPDLLRGRRILVVDDNLINLEVCKEMFALAKADVVTALGAQKAIEALNDADPAIELILLDIHMPEMDGYTLARMLRNSERHKHVKIIGYTASQLFSDREAALRAGMDEVFVKGGEPQRLISLCAEQIQSA